MAKVREKELVKNTLILSIGRFAMQAVSFLLLPFYTYILSTEEYGVVDVLNTVVSLGLPIISLQMEQAIFRYLVESRQRHNKTEEDIIVSGFKNVLIQCAIGLALCFIGSLLFKNEYTWYLAANIVFAVIATVELQISRGLGKMVDYSIASFLGSLVTIVVNIVALSVFHMGVVGILLGNITGQLVICVYLGIRLRIVKKLFAGKYDKMAARGMRKYSLPLVPNELSWWVFNASDRIIVTAIIGASANGILAAVSKFSSAYTTVYNIFYIGWVESMSLHIDDKDATEYFNNILNIICKLFFFVMLLLISCMWIIYPILVNAKFDDGYALFPLLILGGFFDVLVGLLGTFYVAKKNTKAIAGTSIIAAVINAVTNLALINFIGVFAAAVSTVIAFGFLAVYRMWDLRRKYGLKVSIKRVPIALILLAATVVVYYVNITWLNILSMVLVIIISVAFGLVYSKRILKLFRKES